MSSIGGSGAKCVNECTYYIQSRPNVRYSRILDDVIEKFPLFYFPLTSQAKSTTKVKY